MKLHKFLSLVFLLLAAPSWAIGPIPVSNIQSSGKRDVASNENLLADNVSPAPTVLRKHNVSKKRILPTNANWKDFRITFANWIKAKTSEGTLNYPTRVVKHSIYVNGVFYPATFDNGSTYKVVPAGQFSETDVIRTPWIPGGTEIDVRTKYILPLLFKNQTVNFTDGDTITGTTSGATATLHSQTDSGTTGKLVIVNETGAFVANEPITSNTGGAAEVDFTTTQITMTGYASQPAFFEGVISTNSTNPDYTVGNAYTTRMIVGNPTISGGNITALQVITSGSGYTSPGNIWAWQLGPDGILYQKNIANTNTAHTTITLNSGTPPTGLPAWTNPNFSVGEGGDFGAATNAIYDISLLTGIPDRQTQSLTILGDSIARGYTSTDGTGDIRHNYGILSRLVAPRIGVVNLSTSGAALANEVQYATTFSRSYNLMMGKTTHALMAIGTNDVTAGSTKSGITANLNNLANYVRSFGTKVGVSTLIPRGSSSNITGITQASSAVVTVANNFSVGDNVYFGNTDLLVSISGMTQMRGLTGTITSASSTQITVNIDSSAFSAYTSGGGVFSLNPVTQKAATGFGVGGIADQLNDDIRNGVIQSDFAYFDMRPYFQDPTSTHAWKSTLGTITTDFVHPNQLGITGAANDNTLQTYWKSFGRN